MAIPTAINRLGIWGDVVITIAPSFGQYGVFINRNNTQASGAVSSAMTMKHQIT